MYPHVLAMVMDEFLQWMILDAIDPCHIDIIPPKDLPVLFFYWYIRGFTAILRIPLNPWFLKRGYHMYIHIYINICSPPPPPPPPQNLPFVWNQALLFQKIVFPTCINSSCFHGENASTLPKIHCPYDLLLRNLTSYFLVPCLEVRFHPRLLRNLTSYFLLAGW